jgi:hypothetical protein
MVVADAARVPPPHELVLPAPVHVTVSKREANAVEAVRVHSRTHVCLAAQLLVVGGVVEHASSLNGVDLARTGMPADMRTIRVILMMEKAGGQVRVVVQVQVQVLWCDQPHLHHASHFIIVSAADSTSNSSNNTANHHRTTVRTVAAAAEVPENLGTSVT